MNKFLTPKKEVPMFEKKYNFEDFKPKIRGGKNKLLCKKLFGVGYTAQSMGLRLNFTAYDNHVWIPQIDQGEKHKGKTIYVCVNCGSIVFNGELVSNLGG